MPDHSDAEYAALRPTVRERGTARMVIVPLIFVGWAASSIATAAAIGIPIASIVPLIVLAAGFESVFALHMSAERIGRHLQTLQDHDAAGEPMPVTFSRVPGAPDPLFGRLFVLATSVNFIPIVLQFEYVAELAILTLPHFLLINRIRLARKAAE